MQNNLDELDFILTRLSNRNEINPDPFQNRLLKKSQSTDNKCPLGQRALVKSNKVDIDMIS
jgi:hypothetical protein